MLGFSGAERAGSGGRTRRLAPAGAVRAAAGLALYLCAGALACAQDLTQSFEAPARMAFDTASVEANVAGLVILSLMLLATITAVLHLIGRRIWTRRVQRARDGACANQRQTRPRRADAARRIADPRLMGAPGRGADDRGRFRPGRRFAAVVARARLRLMAQSAAGGQDQGRDGAAPRPRRSVRRRCRSACAAAIWRSTAGRCPAPP